MPDRVCIGTVVFERTELLQLSMVLFAGGVSKLHVIVFKL